MKKILFVFFSMILCLLPFYGCDLEEKPLTLTDSMDIPEDGIVAAEVFKALKEENKVITFCGKSGDISYEWTVFGSDIREPKDVNLKLNVTEDAKDKISFSLCGEEDFPFVPLLSLHSSFAWSDGNALVFREGETDPLCSASVTGSATTVLNFSVEETGSFTIMMEEVPEEEKPEEEEPQEEVSSEETESGPKSDPKGSTPEKTKKEPENASRSSGSSGNEKQTEEPAPENKAEKETEQPSPDDPPERKLSDGKETKQDAYHTDPVPEGKPLPVDQEDQEVNEEKTYTCTFSIECSTILNNLEELDPDKLDSVPSNGVILRKMTVVFYEGESVYDVLERVCRENGIHLEASWTPLYGSAYVEGIHNLYEFDCGTNSGWMYRVNGWYPNYGCSRYLLAQGDVVEWRYTCDLGADVGGGYAIGG